MNECFSLCPFCASAEQSWFHLLPAWLPAVSPVAFLLQHCALTLSVTFFLQRTSMTILFQTTCLMFGNRWQTEIIGKHIAQHEKTSNNDGRRSAEDQKECPMTRLRWHRHKAPFASCSLPFSSHSRLLCRRQHCAKHCKMLCAQIWPMHAWIHVI